MMIEADELDALRIRTPPVTLREMALDRLRAAIVSGLFKPGQRLVERTLCEQLGVSRSVIREVLRHLDAEGLITSAPNQGPIVARLDWDTARQIYEIRAALESAAVEACARAADAETKSRLRAAFAGIEQGAGAADSAAVLRATTVFYEIIFRTGGRAISWEVVQRLNGRISQLRVMTLGTANRMTTGPARLREIFEAIERNDPQAAGRSCHAHVAEAAKIAEALLVGKAEHDR